jgi:hypothetical protein
MTGLRHAARLAGRVLDITVEGTFVYRHFIDGGGRP